MCDTLPPEAAQLAQKIHTELLQDGSVLHGESLRKALGFRSVAAMTKAIARKKVVLPFFRMPPRRGVFVLSLEVATYLARQRAEAGGLCLPGNQEGGAAMP